MIIGSHPYSNLTCISSWYICIPNIIWIHQTIIEKMNGNSFSRSFLSLRATTRSFNDNWVAPIFELALHLFMIHLYTKYHLNPSNHHWENEQKLSLSWVWRIDGRQDGEPDGHRHTIIRHVFNGRIKMHKHLFCQQVLTTAY
jgi:hypothetical protein